MTGPLQSPQGLAVDENNAIYVADWGNNRVQIYWNLIWTTENSVSYHVQDSFIHDGFFFQA